jgi:hypothetical protein
MRGVDPDTLADELRASPKHEPIPDYADSCHTRARKKAGATKAQFFRAEHAALRPFQSGFFGDLVDG